MDKPQFTPGLLELAERCEAATGPDSKLDREIAVASGRYVEGRGRDGMLAPADRPNEFSYGQPDYTASVDAALTLVPELKGQSPYPQVYRYTPTTWRAHIGYCNKAVGQLAEAATPALAICAAALRARAAQ